MSKSTNHLPEDGPPSVDQLIRAARDGDSDARGQLIDQCRDYLLLVANQDLDVDLKRKLGASDLVQESMLAAHQCFDRFEGHTERDFLAWIKGILANGVKHTRREFKGVQKRQVNREAFLDGSVSPAPYLKDPQLTPSRDAMRAEEATVVQQAMTRLPENYREVLELRNWQHLSFEDIAERTGRSVDATRKLWYRAIIKLRTELNGNEIE